MSEKTLNAKYSLMMAIHWALIAVSSAFLTQLLQFKGYSSWEIGVISSVKLVATMVFQVLIGAFADKHRKTIALKNIIAILSLITAVETLILYFMPHNIYAILILFVGFGGSVTCLSPLIDSLSILYNNQGKKVSYVVARAFGSATWAIACVALGIICEKMGVNNILWLQLVFALMLMGVAFNMPKVDNSVNKKEKTNTHSVMFLLKNYPCYSLFLIASIFMYMGYMYGTLFLINVVEDLGGNNTHYGIIEFVMAISEVPSAFIFYKLYRKISLNYILLCCMIFMMIKSMGAAFAPNVTVIIVSQCCEMLGAGLFYAASVHFVEDNLPKADAIKAMSVINAVCVGLGEGLGSFTGGFLREFFGLYGLMYISVLAGGLSVLVTVVLCFVGKGRNIKKVYE